MTFLEKLLKLIADCWSLKEFFSANKKIINQFYKLGKGESNALDLTGSDSFDFTELAGDLSTLLRQIKRLVTIEDASVRFDYCLRSQIPNSNTSSYAQDLETLRTELENLKQKIEEFRDETGFEIQINPLVFDSDGNSRELDPNNIQDCFLLLLLKNKLPEIELPDSTTTFKLSKIVADLLIKINNEILDNKPSRAVTAKTIFDIINSPIIDFGIIFNRLFFSKPKDFTAENGIRIAELLMKFKANNVSSQIIDGQFYSGFRVGDFFIGKNKNCDFVLCVSSNIEDKYFISKSDSVVEFRTVNNSKGSITQVGLLSEIGIKKGIEVVKLIEGGVESCIGDFNESGYLTKGIEVIKDFIAVVNGSFSIVINIATNKYQVRDSFQYYDDDEAKPLTQLSTDQLSVLLNVIEHCKDVNNEIVRAIGEIPKECQHAITQISELKMRLATIQSEEQEVDSQECYSFIFNNEVYSIERRIGKTDVSLSYKPEDQALSIRKLPSGQKSEDLVSISSNEVLIEVDGYKVTLIKENDEWFLRHRNSKLPERESIHGLKKDTLKKIKDILNEYHQTGCDTLAIISERHREKLPENVNEKMNFLHRLIELINGLTQKEENPKNHIKELAEKKTQLRNSIEKTLKESRGLCEKIQDLANKNTIDAIIKELENSLAETLINSSVNSGKKKRIGIRKVNRNNPKDEEKIDKLTQCISELEKIKQEAEELVAEIKTTIRGNQEKNEHAAPNATKALGEKPDDDQTEATARTADTTKSDHTKFPDELSSASRQQSAAKNQQETPPAQTAKSNAGAESPKEKKRREAIEARERKNQARKEADAKRKEALEKERYTPKKTKTTGIGTPKKKPKSPNSDDGLTDSEKERIQAIIKKNRTSSFNGSSSKGATTSSVETTQQQFVVDSSSTDRRNQGTEKNAQEIDTTKFGVSLLNPNYVFGKEAYLKGKSPDNKFECLLSTNR